MHSPAPPAARAPPTHHDVDTTGAYAYNAFTGDQSDTPRLWSKVAGHSGRASVLYATGSIDVVPPDILNAKLLVTADAE